MSRRIAIVGNGSIPAGLSTPIDAADLVIRFNDCRSVGRGGRKTDIVALCNTGRPARAMLDGDSWRALAPVRAAASFCCVRDPVFYAALRPKLLARYPDLDDFCDDYTPDFERFAAESGRDMRIVPAELHVALEAQLETFRPHPYAVPSSGAIVIADVLQNLAGARDEIVIAGFGHEGWERHPFAAERQWVDSLVAGGRLHRLDAGRKN
ncbi:Urease operon accessory protein [Shinella daejeonensis]|uniref:Urease operon accessory protein n=1 Tax=Shinella daejeonensis TaxID=659017 RepID=UPI0020C75D66|nr:Urease operon accessory protein [Shinella daejeonensis]MCP8894126.1 Urease operon accessory protein [Shinella daejeonensis]